MEFCYGRSLIDTLLHQHNMGNRINGTFTTQAYDYILEEMKKLFPDKPLDKDKIQNHIKYIKKKFALVWNLFKGGFSGFVWNRVTCKFDAENNVWEQLIQQNPVAADWRNKSFFLPYDKLSILYGGDKDMSRGACTATEMRESLKKEANISTSKEIDELIYENHVDPEGCRANVHETENGPASAPADGQSQLSQRAFKRSKGEANEGAGIELVKKVIDRITTAITNFAYNIGRRKVPLPITEYEIVNLLDELEIKGHLHEQCYLFLVDNPAKLRALISYPQTRRKSLLMLMMSTAPPSCRAH